MSDLSLLSEREKRKKRKESKPASLGQICARDPGNGHSAAYRPHGCRHALAWRPRILFSFFFAGGAPIRWLRSCRLPTHLVGDENAGNAQMMPEIATFDNSNSRLLSLHVLVYGLVTYETSADQALHSENGCRRSIIWFTRTWRPSSSSSRPEGAASERECGWNGRAWWSPCHFEQWSFHRRLLQSWLHFLRLLSW